MPGDQPGEGCARIEDVEAILRDGDQVEVAELLAQGGVSGKVASLFGVPRTKEGRCSRRTGRGRARLGPGHR